MLIETIYHTGYINKKKTKKKKHSRTRTE